MAPQTLLHNFRTIVASSLLAAMAVTLFVSVAEARRARSSVTGAYIGAGVGALMDGSSGARTGAAAGALIGAVR